MQGYILVDTLVVENRYHVGWTYSWVARAASSPDDGKGQVVDARGQVALLTASLATLLETLPPRVLL